MQNYFDIDVQRPGPAAFFSLVSRDLKSRLPPDGARRLRDQVRMFLRWFGGRPDQVTPGGAGPFLRMLADGGADRAALSGFHAGLRIAFDQLHGRSVMAGVRVPACRPCPPALALGQVAQILARGRDPFERLLLGLLYFTGGTVRQTLAIRWRDVQIASDHLLLNASPRRALALPPPLARMASELAAASPPTRHVFAATPEVAISPRTALRVVTRAAKGLGITPPVTCGSLPQAFAVHLVRAGGDVRRLHRSFIAQAI